MSYALTLGKDEKWMSQQAGKRGQALLPAKMRDPPDLEFGLELFWYAFLELNTCRTATMDGALPIPFTATVDYAKVYEIEGEQFDDLLYFVREMDRVYLEEDRKKRKVPSRGRK